MPVYPMGQAGTPVQIRAGGGKSAIMAGPTDAPAYPVSGVLNLALFRRSDSLPNWYALTVYGTGPFDIGSLVNPPTGSSPPAPITELRLTVRTATTIQLQIFGN